MTLIQFTVVITSLLTLSFTACARKVDESSDRDRAMANLRQTMAALAAARAGADGDGWSRHVTNEYVVIHPDGRIHDRSEEILELNASTPTAQLVRTDERFHWHGKHTVVYASDFISIRGQPVRAIEVWINEAGVWKIAAAQVTRIQ